MLGGGGSSYNLGLNSLQFCEMRRRLDLGGQYERGWFKLIFLAFLSYRFNVVDVLLSCWR